MISRGFGHEAVIQVPRGIAVDEPLTPNIRCVFDRLLTRYGEQHWWPADSPFEVITGAVLTQNTSWTNAERALANLHTADALDPVRLVRAHSKTVAKWLRPSGCFNVKTRRLRALCQWVLDNGGLDTLSRRHTRALRDGLLTVNGVGPETADAILLYAFGRPVFVVDAYTRRVFSRLGLCDGDQTYKSLQQRFHFKLKPDVGVFGEYHALIVRHGKEVCRPRPLCSQCCLTEVCPYA